MEKLDSIRAKKLCEWKLMFRRTRVKLIAAHHQYLYFEGGGLIGMILL